MTSVERNSTADQRAGPASVRHYHTHNNQPIVYPYKPGDKPPPPGASLYKDVWMIFKVATQTFLWGCNPEVYSLGFIAGAFKGAIEWSENGPPKKIASDAEIIDFGATAHSSTFLSQVYIVAENIFALVAPIKVESWFPSTESSGHNNPNLSSELNNYLTRRTTGILPSTVPECISFGFTAYHSILTGEEVVQRIARWADTSKEKNKQGKL